MKRFADLITSKWFSYAYCCSGLAFAFFVPLFCKVVLLSLVALAIYTELPAKRKTKGKYGLTLVVAFILLLQPTRAVAMFPVIDPASIAQMGKIWSQDVSTYTKIVEEVQLAYQNYQLALTMAQAIKNKDVYAIKGAVRVGESSVANHYGETAGWNDAVNSGLSISRAYQNATIPMAANNSFLSSETLGSSSHLAALARVGIIDDASQRTMAVSAQINNQQAANAGAVRQWEASVYSSDPALNTTAAQQNLTNLGQVQMFEQGRALLTVNSLLAQQITVRNMQERDQAVRDLNRWQSLTDYQTSQAHSLGGLESTIQNHQPY